MVLEGKVFPSLTDYILGTYHRLFWNVYVWDPRHNNDHYMVLRLLCRAPEREHARYRWVGKNLPLRPLAEPKSEDGIFAALRRAMPKPHIRERRNNGWISEDTWRLVYKRVSARRKTKDQLRIQRLRRAIVASLKRNRKRRVEAAGEEV